jgi:hypothetical protein
MEKLAKVFARFGGGSQRRHHEPEVPLQAGEEGAFVEGGQGVGPLPVELALAILELLDGTELACASLVNRTWQR